MRGSGLRGRLEICINNAWGTICDTRFGLNELEVACNELGGTGTLDSELHYILELCKMLYSLFTLCSC